MKNDLVWTKTLLTIYRYLERICGAIDKIVMQSALNSSNIWGQNYHRNNAYSISQKLIDLSERKVVLINLKILIDENLKSIDKGDAKILIERYFDGIKCKDIAEKQNISIRTVFRKIAVAEKAFFRRLLMKGYNEIRIRHMLKNESWINSVYFQLSEKNDDGLDFSNSFLAKAVSL